MIIIRIDCACSQFHILSTTLFYQFWLTKYVMPKLKCIYQCEVNPQRRVILVQQWRKSYHDRNNDTLLRPLNIGFRWYQVLGSQSSPALQQPVTSCWYWRLTKWLCEPALRRPQARPASSFSRLNCDSPLTGRNKVTQSEQACLLNSAYWH